MLTKATMLEFLREQVGISEQDFCSDENNRNHWRRIQRDDGSRQFGAIQ